ncbi:MAG TPA: Trk system potassium transporter TrkA [Candidatus Mediterraneibacter merdipullorum]|nr:Trk system potassium transporter TrkA [Candidatus Mediterraneibacter merdipullorum]
MKIVIIGDGKVGYKLAKQLSVENYDVVMIDSNEKKLRFAVDRLDIACVTGDAADAEVQKEADVPHADLVIACTSADECNMLSCLIARRLGAKHTIARVRNPIYFKQIGLLKEDLHLSMAVNPELIVADEISRLLLFPDASKIETFVKGRVELIEFPVGKDTQVVDMSLADMYARFQIKLLVCAVEHGDEVLIPDGDYRIREGDRLHVAVSHSEVERFFSMFGKHKGKIRKVIICGGGRVAYYLAMQLLKLGMQIKIIERDEKRCEELCELLPKATIINGDATDHDLLIEEGIEEADAFVGLTGMDEENIITALFAKTQGASKIIAKINEDRRASMVEDFGIDSIVSAKTATADAILSYVRARKNSQSSANVETLYQLVDEQVEALEFIIKSETKYTGVPLKELSIRPNNLIACIARKRQIIIPGGDDCMEVGDSVIVVTMDSHIEDLEDILVQVR